MADAGFHQHVLGTALQHGLDPHVLAAAPSFTEAVLKSIGAPVTPNTTKALSAWQAAEGGPSDNPLNTTLGQGNAQGSAIKGYGSTSAGVSATTKTLQNGLYKPVLQAFRRNESPDQIRAAIIESPWSGSSHYAGTDYAKGLVTGTPSGGGAVPAAPATSRQATPTSTGVPAPTSSIPAALLPTPVPAGPTTKDMLTSLLLASNGKPLTSAQILGAIQPVRAATTAPAAPTAAPTPTSTIRPAQTPRQITPTSPGASGPLRYLGPAPASLLGPGSVYAGPDQGLDFTNTGRQVPVHALGDAVITQVVPSGSGWSGQGGLLVYQLTSGPQKGRYVYTAEDFLPSAGLKPGSTIRQGDQIGVATGAGQAPGIETGFAMNAQGQAYGNPHEGKAGAPPDPQALAFERFVQNVGPAGVRIHVNPKTGKAIPYRTKAGQ